MIIRIKKNLIKEWLISLGIVVVLIIGFSFLPEKEIEIQGHTTSDLINNSYLLNSVQVEKAVGKIGFFYPPNNRIEYVGTAFVVDTRGYVLTAKHNYQHYSSKFNVDMASLINEVGYVELKDDNGNRHNVRVSHIYNATLERKDVLLLKIVGDIEFKLHSVKIASKENVTSTWTDVGFIGYTSVEENTEMQIFSNKGSISNIELSLKDFTEPIYSVQTDARGGFSGAPVFLAHNGQVIGLVRGGNEIKSIVFVPPIHKVPAIIEQLEKNS